MVPTLRCNARLALARVEEARQQEVADRLVCTADARAERRCIKPQTMEVGVETGAQAQ